MRDIEFTFREILVSVVIALLMLGLGFFIAESIRDKVSSDNEKYFKALKINNQAELFDYAIRTEVGDVLSFGQFKANQPISDRLIKGKYFAINKTEEHYTMHTRTVSYKCGKHTCHRTETYWTWDEVGNEKFTTKTFSFLGRNFNYNLIDFHNYDYIDTVKTSSYVRFKFDGIPLEFKGTLFSNTKNNTIKENVLFPSESIKEVINDKENSAGEWVIGFWVAWSIFIIAGVIGFMALENRYLNNN